MRLFIGIVVPPDVRTRLQEAWTAVTSCPANCRQIDPTNWHFTLAFLGQVPEQNLEPLVHLIEKAVEHPPKGSFSFTEFETFPSKHPSYLIARANAEPRDNWMGFIQHLREMVSVAAPSIDRKPWVPHVTIARAKKGRLLPRWSNPIAPFEWTPHELTLIRSTPTQNGSLYTDLHAFPFNL
ncbi:RNA 2',3'-cyclic phosphodiesterase [Candidatus Uhrbacteria bacterium]|nr:RNA 2',3'-cyclic phosphodiesterase [Candidatus Uhrbacteria bacterium]